ncbi:DNA-binding protein [Roseobacter sp. GAI101]|uniref:DNA-binding protein n=1 Tax=Roseobacter sp. (strain GAI101) TaxID=391589 RepID=UPI000560CAF1|nr:DNA-binding protein [Roseobacter sp. GAI101]
MKLTAEDIASVVDDLLKETGTVPTVRKVRSRLARGSMSTITAVMSAWRAEREELAMVPSPVIAASMRAAGQIWRQAQSLGIGAANAVDRTLLAALETLLTQAYARIAELEVESEKRRVAIHSLHRSIEIANRSADDAKQALVAATLRAETLEEMFETKKAWPSQNSSRFRHRGARRSRGGSSLLKIELNASNFT